jgi:excisionase family DNA binding protein
MHEVKTNYEEKMPITYTLQRAAEESGLSIRGFLYAIERGELESVKSGRRRLIPADALEIFLLGSRRQGSAM